MKRQCQIIVKRQIRVEGQVAYIPLTKGFEAIVDVADLPKVSGFNWSASGRKKPYAWRSLPHDENGTRGHVRMHRIIIDCPNHLCVDHIDGNVLNNRRANLRIATVAENCRNRGHQRNNSIGLKGVDFMKRRRKWRARITIDKVVKELGYFDCPQLAYAAYCAANQTYHGEFGRVG